MAVVGLHAHWPLPGIPYGVAVDFEAVGGFHAASGGGFGHAKLGSYFGHRDRSLLIVSLALPQPHPFRQAQFLEHLPPVVVGELVATEIELSTPSFLQSAARV